MNNMKQYLVTLLLLFTLSFSGFSQNTENRFQKIETAKIAFITKELDLTPKEAQRFFPVYNEYRKEMREIQHQNRGERKDFKQRKGLEYDSSVLECKKKYRAQFTKVLSATKAARFFEVERKFREQLFKELENRSKRKR